MVKYWLVEKGDKQMKKLIIIISILLLATPLFAADYYVDFTGGLDSNPGTSSGQAWKTIAKVYSKMPTFQQGDNILFKRGETWAPGTDQDGLMVTCVGASGNHIKFGAYGTGPKPKISFKGETGDGRYSGVDEVCIYISSQSGYITIENFQLEGAANNMAVEFTGVGSPRAPIYIDYCDISGDGYSSEALVANNFSDNSRVSHCTFDATNVYSKAVEVKVGSGVVVSDCVINGYTNAGGIRYSNHANNGIIERNYIYNPMTDLAWAIVYRSADHGGVIRNNLIDMRGTTLSDKNLRGITGWLGTNGREVYNNTIIGDGHGSAFKVEDLGWIIKNNLSGS